MNMRTYYQKIRDIEQAILEPVVILESNETADGGKEGLLTEVPKRLAAKMIVDGRARLANEQSTREFHEKKAEAKRTADQEAITNKMQMMLVPTAELMKSTERIADFKVSFAHYYNAIGQYAEVSKNGQEALKLAQESGLMEYARMAYHEMAIAAFKMGRYEPAYLFQFARRTSCDFQIAALRIHGCSRLWSFAECVWLLRPGLKRKPHRPARIMVSLFLKNFAAAPATKVSSRF